MNTHFNHSEMPKFMNGFSQQMRFSMAMNQRIIMLYDDVDDNSMMESIYYLNKLKYMDEKFCDDKKPIEIQINTCGGAVEDGLSLLSLIENMKSDGYRIITTNIGRGYSMGSFYQFVAQNAGLTNTPNICIMMYHMVCMVSMVIFWNKLSLQKKSKRI